MARELELQLQSYEPQLHRLLGACPKINQRANINFADNFKFITQSWNNTIKQHLIWSPFLSIIHANQAIWHHCFLYLLLLSWSLATPLKVLPLDTSIPCFCHNLGSLTPHNVVVFGVPMPRRGMGVFTLNLGIPPPPFLLPKPIPVNAPIPPSFPSYWLVNFIEPYVTFCCVWYVRVVTSQACW